MCRVEDDEPEDVELGRCMENVGVKAGDSRDDEGKNRFMPIALEHHLIPGYIPKDSWYWDYVYYKEEEGLAACSDSAIRKGSIFKLVKLELTYSLSLFANFPKTIMLIPTYLASTM